MIAALAALVIHQIVPWPEFFTIRGFGPSRFVAASLVHLANIWLVTRRDVREHCLDTAADAARATGATSQSRRGSSDA